MIGDEASGTSRHHKCLGSMTYDPLYLNGGVYLIGRNEMPLRLGDWWCSPKDEPYDRRRLRNLLMGAWPDAEYPAHLLDPMIWWEMFTEAGFVSDCLHHRPPRRARTLWRGCAPGHEHGMSWTNRREVAERFAGRFASRYGGVVVSVVAPPSAVLARFLHVRDEAEFVLDPMWIEDHPDIEVVTTLARHSCG